MSRETDVLIAEKVMGCEWRHEPDWPGGAADILGGEAFPGVLAERRDGRLLAFGGLPSFRGSIADAWRVVEKMGKKGYDFRCGVVSDGSWAEFRHYEEPVDHPIQDGGRAAIDPRDGDMPLAICLAALRAVGVELEEEK